MAPALAADGLHFVGIDVVDGHLTEVNVTSPTGLRQLCGLSGTRPDVEVILWLERRATSHFEPAAGGPTLRSVGPDARVDESAVGPDG